MRVGRDGHSDAPLLAHPKIDVLQVQPVGIGIALHGHAVFQAGFQHLFHVVIERIAAQQQSPRRVRDNLRVRIFDCRKHALRHGRTVDIEVGVDRANYHVQLRKNLVGVIERSVFENINFGAG